MIPIKTDEEVNDMSIEEKRQYAYDLIMSLTKEERAELLRKYKERKDGASE